MLHYAVFVAIGTVIAAQSPGDKPQFDVASVKPCDPHTRVGTNGGDLRPGRVDLTCETLMNYIRAAYGTWGNGRPILARFNIVGGPAWIDHDLYEIHAKAEGSPSAGSTAGPMMQALLEDRFKLKIHRETREVPVYALVVAKGSPKLPVAKVACYVQDPDHRLARPKEGQPYPPMCGRGKSSNDGIEVHGSTMAEFCTALTLMPLHLLDRRKFIDKTGITGRFDFDLKFQDEAAEEPRTDDFMRLQDALLKVGLRLTSAKGPDEFIVIDHAEHPTAN